MTDTRGSVTDFAYDDFGDLIRQADSRGVRSDSLGDSN